jgi:uncharacterized protein (DUF1015 family)
MPEVRTIDAITYCTAETVDVSSRIAPPYDVLDEVAKAKLLAADSRNIVAVDLPHLPAKTVGPDAVYAQAGRMYRQWLQDGVLQRRGTPAMFAYRQTYTAHDQVFKRRALFANVRVQPLGSAPNGAGGIYPHEQTFSGPKEDRLKLMRATAAQLSPIFGLHSDADDMIGQLLRQRIEQTDPDCTGVTANDDVVHELWAIEDQRQIDGFATAFLGRDLFIADGHHRYNTAINYRNELVARHGELPADHPANFCLFALVAMQDPGMIILPTHRVLGGMANFNFARFVEAATDLLEFTRFPGENLEALQAALPSAGSHAVGLYDPADARQPLWIATTVSDDPLARQFRDKSKQWRQLDVAIVQHLIVEQICEPTFCPAGQQVTWKFPHTLVELKAIAQGQDGALGVVMQPTPLEAVRKISENNELMPQKSTFFYPKLATGLVIHPLE